MPVSTATTAAVTQSAPVTTAPSRSSGFVQMRNGGAYSVTVNSNVQTGLASRADSNAARSAGSPIEAGSSARRCLFGSPTPEESQHLRGQVEQVQADDLQRVLNNHGGKMAVKLLPGNEFEYTGKTVQELLNSDDKASGVQSDSSPEPTR